MKNIRLSEDAKRDMRLTALYYRLPKVRQYAEEQRKQFPAEPLQVAYRKAIARIMDEAYDRALKRLENNRCDWNDHNSIVYNVADALLHEYKTLTTSLRYAASTANDRGYALFVIDKKSNVAEPNYDKDCLLKGDKYVTTPRALRSHPLAIAARTYKWEHASLMENVLKLAKKRRDQEQLTYRLNNILDRSKPKRVYDNIRKAKKQREAYMEASRRYNESREFLDGLVADATVLRGRSKPPEPMLKAMNDLLDNLKSYSTMEYDLWDRTARKNKRLMTDLNNVLGDLIKAENRADDIAAVLSRLGEVRNITTLNGGGEEE